MLALLLKSKNLARHCNLIDGSVDLYQEINSWIREKLRKMLEIAEALSPKLKEFFTNFSKEKFDLCKTTFPKSKNNYFNEKSKILLEEHNDEILILKEKLLEIQCISDNEFRELFLLEKCIYLRNSISNKYIEFCLGQRSFLKQNIMTISYGSTTYGRKMQLIKQFKRICFKEGFFP